jgi:hypothetical protein
MRYTKILLLLSLFTIYAVNIVVGQVVDSNNPYNAYQSEYGIEVNQEPYTLNIRSFAAYPSLFATTSDACQITLNQYNYYLLRNHQYNVNDQTPDQTTLSTLDEISSFVYLSSHYENDFEGYEGCRDDFNQRYYILHRQNRFFITHFGMCMPSVCTPDDVLTIIEGLRRIRSTYGSDNVGDYDTTPALYTLLDADYPLRVYDSDTENDNAKDHPFSQVVFWSVIITALVLFIAGTLYHIYKNVYDEQIDELHRNINLWRFEHNSSIFERMFLIGFSGLRSWEKLFDTRSKYDATALITLRGFKFIFSIWLAVGIFSYVYYIPVYPQNKIYDDISKDFLFTPGKALFLLVDCLLWMSGIYTAYGFLYELVKKHDYSNLTWTQYIMIYTVEYFNKFVKLLAIIFIAAFIYSVGATTIGNGPVFSEKHFFMSKRMRDYFYTYLIFVNNLIDIDNQGMIWASFLALEIQFFIFSLPIINLFLTRRNFSYLIIASAMVGSLVASNFWAHCKDVDISVIKDALPLIEYQQKIWNKAFPYCFGILTGF